VSLPQRLREADGTIDGGPGAGPSSTSTTLTASSDDDATLSLQETFLNLVFVLWALILYLNVTMFNDNPGPSTGGGPPPPAHDDTTTMTPSNAATAPSSAVLPPASPSGPAPALDTALAPKMNPVKRGAGSLPFPSTVGPNGKHTVEYLNL
jgi:hypothetical protein